MPLSLLSPFKALFSPTPDAARVAWLADWAFAHRGLHDGMFAGPILENSMGAFAAAIAAGVGIECDVQQSSDGLAVVFHDEMLERLTHNHGAVASHLAADLEQMPLRGDNGCIPNLAKMLDFVKGRVPILIEIKAEGEHVGRLCLSVRRALEGYGGKVAVMSFNPHVVKWFVRNAAHIAAGLVVTEQGTKSVIGHLYRRFSIWSAAPHFLAYDIRDLPSKLVTEARQRGLAVVTWTVRSEAEHALAEQHADAPIFEAASPSPAAAKAHNGQAGQRP